MGCGRGGRLSSSLPSGWLLWWLCGGSVRGVRNIWKGRVCLIVLWFIVCFMSRRRVQVLVGGLGLIAYLRFAVYFVSRRRVQGIRGGLGLLVCLFQEQACCGVAWWPQVFLRGAREGRSVGTHAVPA